MPRIHIPNQNHRTYPGIYGREICEGTVNLQDFFSKLPTQKQAELESKIDVNAWNWSKSQKAYVPRKTTRGSVSGGARKEYFAGSQMPIGIRKAAPVCDDWPDTGYWLSTNSNKRHNQKCENYRKTRGYPCKKNEGKPCKKCGG